MQTEIIAIKEQILGAQASGNPLLIRGGGSRSFIGREIQGELLEIASCQGVLSYEPTELYITVGAGTRLTEINQILEENRQMLAFEPAVINKNSTIGGVIATGLSGPRRPYSGAVRDHVLGIRCLNGRGEDLSFGGQVMKNVAGYDLSRLMTGAYGTLGVILSVSIKTMPKPEHEFTFCESMPVKDACKKIQNINRQQIPVSACCYDGDTLYVRLSTNHEPGKLIAGELGLTDFQEGSSFFKDLRDYKLSFFNTNKPIWRLSLPRNAEPDFGNDRFMIDWSGAQYWLISERPTTEMFNLAEQCGGSAMLFKGGDRKQDVFPPLTGELLRLQKGLKQAFDPKGILNPGKMYAGI